MKYNIIGHAAINAKHYRFDSAMKKSLVNTNLKDLVVEILIMKGVNHA